MIIGAMKSMPTAELERILNLTPIHLHIKTEALDFGFHDISMRLFKVM